MSRKTRITCPCLDDVASVCVAVMRRCQDEIFFPAVFMENGCLASGRKLTGIAKNIHSPT